MGENDKTKGEMGHWWTYISECNDDLLLKVLAVANKLNCESLMRLCSARTCDRIYNCSDVEARAFLGFKCDYTPEQEKEVLAKHPWPHGPASWPKDCSRTIFVINFLT